MLIEDASFAGFLAGQWMGLIEAGMVGEYVASTGAIVSEHALEH